MFRHFSIRWKMTLAALVPLVLVLLLVALAATALINRWVVGEAQSRVRNDLNAAREVLDHEASRVQDVVRFLAHTSGIVRALSGGYVAGVGAELDEIRRREGLDVLNLTDGQGRVVLRPHPGAPPSFVMRTLAGEGYAGAALLDPGQLAAEEEALARRAFVQKRSPDGSAREGAERRGLMLVGAWPIRGGDGEVLGCLYGGVLLNGNLALVDRIKEIVYGDKTFAGVAIGSATVFLEDLRIATTIRLKDERRAMGTTVSSEVAEAVLGRQQTWLDRARVVDAWYLTAYEPIRNVRGESIGALYVGLLEAPYQDLKSKASLILVGLFSFGGVIGFVLSHQISSRLSRPLLKLAAVAEKVAQGEREVDLPESGGDEVGHLTEAFRGMTGALRERESALQELNRELEGKVSERTAQLEEKSLQLIRAQEELLRSETLAAIGSLAAGVAHEINNPTAIIRGNVEILLMELAEAAEGREEAEEIKQQTERIALITQNMLTFAREQTIASERVDLNALLEEVLTQIGHQHPLGECAIRRELSPGLPPVMGDAQRLRQVFVNLTLNALQAMDGRGVLRVTSRQRDEAVEVLVEDSGPGISTALREKIFNPFFTSKSTGTGLGLSISYGIVKAHGGEISLDSAEGEGARFRILLPLKRS